MIREKKQARMRGWVGDGSLRLPSSQPAAAQKQVREKRCDSSETHGQKRARSHPQLAHDPVPVVDRRLLLRAVRPQNLPPPFTHLPAALRRAASAVGAPSRAAPAPEDARDAVGPRRGGVFHHGRVAEGFVRVEEVDVAPGYLWVGCVGSGVGKGWVGGLDRVSQGTPTWRRRSRRGAHRI